MVSKYNKLRELANLFCYEQAFCYINGEGLGEVKPESPLQRWLIQIGFAWVIMTVCSVFDCILSRTRSGRYDTYLNMSTLVSSAISRIIPSSSCAQT
jgi:hypothetical protein